MSRRIVGPSPSLWGEGPFAYSQFCAISCPSSTPIGYNTLQHLITFY